MANTPSDGDAEDQQDLGSAGTHGSVDTKESKPLLAGLRVLVVDDNTDTLEITAIVLEHAGAVVTVVETALAAVAILASRPIDVVVTDLAMPDRDGFWLLERAKGLDYRFGERPAVIALSAHVRDHVRADARTAGFDRFLTKPLRPAELVAAVAAANDGHG